MNVLFAKAKMVYADVILPLAVEGVFGFAVPEALVPELEPGMRVVVPLGKSKCYGGIVSRLHHERPPYAVVKEIISIVDPVPVVTPQQLALWKWISDYYMCTLGEVMKAALPTALKLEGHNGTLEETEGYRPKQILYLKLNPEIQDEETLAKIRDTLKRAKKQEEALLKFIGTSESNAFKRPAPVSKHEFLRSTGATAATATALEERGILQSFLHKVSRLEQLAVAPRPQPTLTPSQQEALIEINQGFETQAVCLLHGVTGSGKTEIYVHLIQEQLTRGADVLYLVPEIALTTQLISRLRDFFGDQVVVYHSKYTPDQRAESYLSLIGVGRPPKIIVGARSALFLPLRRLGLVIVDEEHDGSYKQSDRTPRYHGRDTAIMLARLGEAKTLLGSATPSVESYFHAVTGKYKLVTLTERYGPVKLPTITLSDTIRAVKRGERRSHFNKELLEHMQQVLERKAQVMLFQNRRGFAPYLECSDCGDTPKCPDCNVTLTYHKTDHSLRCHYCGHTEPVPEKCPECHTGSLDTRGFGTEKVETEIAQLFPNARIVRMDQDSIGSLRSYQRLVTQIERGAVDIIVGTQMITKGFDFGGVELVCVLNGDNLLNYPDFRTAERAFQLLMQVGGRAGRRDRRGEVIIQTAQPTHPVLQQVVHGNFKSLFNTELCERKNYLYPPFCRLVQFTLRHPSPTVLTDAERAFDSLLRPVFGRRLLGPEPPPVDKIRGLHLSQFLLKIEKEKSASQAKILIRKALNDIQQEKQFARLVIQIDVDPI